MYPKGDKSINLDDIEQIHSVFTEELFSSFLEVTEINRKKTTSGEDMSYTDTDIRVVSKRKY